MKAPPGTRAFAYCFRSGVLTPLEALKTPSPLTAKVPLASKMAHHAEDDLEGLESDQEEIPENVQELIDQNFWRLE